MTENQIFIASKDIKSVQPSPNEACTVISYIYAYIKMSINTFKMVVVMYTWFFNKIAKLSAFLQFCFDNFLQFFAIFDILTPRYLKLNPMNLRKFRTF